MMSIYAPITEEMSETLAKSLERVTKRERDTDPMRVVEEMKRSVEETRQKVGTLDVCVDLIRDARNQ